MTDTLHFQTDEERRLREENRRLRDHNRRLRKLAVDTLAVFEYWQPAADRVAEIMRKRA